MKTRKISRSKYVSIHNWLKAKYGKADRCDICHKQYDTGGLNLAAIDEDREHKYIAIRASKTTQRQLKELSYFYGENRSQVIIRLIIQAYERLITNEEEPK